MISVPGVIWTRAKCGDENSDAVHDDFYPERQAEKYTPAADRARAVCRGQDGHPPCPVLLECLAFSLITRDRFGIWGGLSPRERNALRRSKDLSKYPTARNMRSNPYYSMIETYLEENDGCEDEDYPEREDEGLPGDDEE